MDRFESRRLKSYDGTEIAYQVGGEGPAIILSNGLGGTVLAYRHLVEALTGNVKLLSWDYRGLYQSKRPEDLSTLGVEGQVRDLDLLLQNEKIDRAVFIGWSMGVQVNFEYFRQRPERFLGLVAINGTYGSPFNTFAGLKISRHLLPPLLRAARTQHKTVGKIVAAAVQWPGLLQFMQRLGNVSPTVDGHTFLELSRGFGDMDFDVYIRTLLALGDHDASDVLSQVKVPTSIVTGQYDLLTPLKTAQDMQEKISGSKLWNIKGGTHYTPVEYPALVVQAVREVLEQVPGYETVLRKARQTPNRAA